MGGDSTRLIIAQQSDTKLAMPEGTALRIEPGQPIFMQLHYINLIETPADIEGAIELEFADDAQGTPIEVQSVFNGSLSIESPKHQAGSSEYFLKPGGTVQRPLHVFALTSHTHSLGIEATIERVPAIDAPDTTPLHKSLNWHEPPLTTFDPALDFDGSDGLRLRCKYMNTTDVDVHFGTRFKTKCASCGSTTTKTSSSRKTGISRGNTGSREGGEPEGVRTIFRFGLPPGSPPHRLPVILFLVPPTGV